MRHYPAFLAPSNLSCLVIGAGEVGLRKIGTLAACGAHKVLVLDSQAPSARMATLAEAPGIHFEQREFRPSDLEGRNLVFACTSNPKLNAKIGCLARERGILINLADAPEKSSFLVPSTVEQGPLTVAFSTGGASPAMARRIRAEMEEHFGPHYGLFLRLMERIRPMVLGMGRPTPENTALFRSLTASDLLALLASNDRQAVETELANILPGSLSGRIAELLDGIC
ncbi:precorrin-2 dehydrogenase/sirohydrochlorin ferrochelatase family protein [Desulfovibrio ferrophilus]|uniref:precorrin-2 dehydrogenase n=1 Tax=Desulfovibrio ferrophilus TaxID=241368 RepID=A0A2Z6AWL0_9BACT|nr:bifunctional precorrin-2 dehydrogenase/sirohydrochlorin ferrochelatase [Desulfovibrio ferrophilus]BBD07634.1 precorrin-2 dehydrogenase [Desulfovibrio ferrophilus]